MTTREARAQEFRQQGFTVAREFFSREEASRILKDVNDCIVDDEHVTLGWGRDFGDVTPMRGVILGGGEQALEVRVTVTPR